MLFIFIILSIIVVIWFDMYINHFDIVIPVGPHDKQIEYTNRKHKKI